MSTSRKAVSATKGPTVAVPHAGEGKRGEAGHPAYLLRQAAAAVRATMEREFAELAVTHPQFVALVMLDAYPRASGAQLARLALLTPQTLTVILANLERAGLTRRRADAANRRLVLYELTATGSEVLGRCKRIANRVEANMLAGLSREHAEVALRWLADVAMRLQPTAPQTRTAKARSGRAT
jgi:DNA-binding MarR family transcriptional regulator